MLDVHPPHAATHTWRDFFIHIATIVVGLLIAIGLEQAVEAIHQHHERSQLRQDLRVEANNNLELMRLDFQYFDHTQPVIAALRSQVDGVLTHPASHATLSLLPSLTGVCNCFFPDSPVWNTAKESAATALLPRREAAMYDLVYGQQDLMTKEFHAYHDRLAAVSDFTLRFTVNSDQQLELSQMSPADLREYAVLLANLQGELARFRGMTELAQAVTREAAQGNNTDEDAFQRIGVDKRH